MLNAKTKWIHKGTGMLAGQLPGQSRRVKGIVMRSSHVGLVTSYMALVDEEFARDQRERMKKYWQKDATMFGKTATGLKGKRHYTISDMFLVGEAMALAMRTDVRR